MTYDPSIGWADPLTERGVSSDQAMGEMICEGYRILAANMVIMGKVREAAGELGIKVENLAEIRIISGGLLLESQHGRTRRQGGERVSAVSPN